MTEFAQVIFETAQDIILIAPVLPEGRPGPFVSVNPYACARLGYSAEELQQKTPFDITEQRPATMLDELRARGVVRGEMLFVTREGDRIPCDFIIRKSQVEGQPYFLAIARDISELVAARRRSELLVRELSTPILRVSPDVLAMPVIGEVNGERAELMAQRLLDAIASQTPRRFVLDLTGMEVVDASTADHLGRMIRAAQLLGTECVLAGISASLAMTLVRLDVLPSKVSVFATLADALPQRKA